MFNQKIGICAGKWRIALKRVPTTSSHNNNPYVLLCGFMYRFVGRQHALTHLLLCYNYYRALQLQRFPIKHFPTICQQRKWNHLGLTRYCYDAKFFAVLRIDYLNFELLINSVDRFSLLRKIWCKNPPYLYRNLRVTTFYCWHIAIQDNNNKKCETW